MKRLILCVCLLVAAVAWARNPFEWPSGPMRGLSGPIYTPTGTVTTYDTGDSLLLEGSTYGGDYFLLEGGTYGGDHLLLEPQ